MALVGYQTNLKASGAGLSFSNEACTDSGDHLTYQITNAVKQVWDPTATITVKIDGASQAQYSGYTLDRLTGRITFTGSQVGHTITVSGTYLPMTSIASATGFKFSCKRTNAENSTLNDDGYVSRQGLLKDVTGNLTRFDLADKFFQDAIEAGAVLVVEQTYSSGTLGARVWAMPANDDQEAQHDALIMESFDWEGCADIDGNVISFA